MNGLDYLKARRKHNKLPGWSEMEEIDLELAELLDKLDYGDKKTSSSESTANEVPARLSESQKPNIR